MPQSPVADPANSETPASTFGKILAATPVVMTVIATLLAGLASSEMTKAQYDRSMAAQHQSKAGDQWGYFQAKRLRAALQRNALDIVHATAEVHPLDVSTLKRAAEQMPESSRARTELLGLLESVPGQQALAGVTAPDALSLPPVQPLDAKVQAAIELIGRGGPELEITKLIAQLKPETVDDALRAARDRAEAYDASAKPLNQTLDAVDKLLSAGPLPGATGPSISRDFAVARLRYAAERYDAEARLNQSIGNLYEVQVRVSNFTAERHRMRSDRFFVGMLIAQAAVITSTLAMAARQRNVLWLLAAAAGIAAIVFAIYVYLWV